MSQFRKFPDTRFNLRYQDLFVLIRGSKMKPLSGILLFFLLLGQLLAGCNSAGLETATELETPTNLPSNTIPPTSAPSSTPVPISLPSSTTTATRLPSTPTSPAPTQTLDPNARSVDFNGFKAVIPSVLGQGATFKIIPAVIKNNQTWLVAPQYVLMMLTGYHTPKGSYLTPEIYFFPAQEYSAVNSEANASLQRLQAILANPSTPLTNDILPWLPFTPGEQSIAAQPKIISFKDGSGVRMVTQYDIFLDPIVTAPGAPIVNRLLFYHFEGLSTDGKTYIVAILPLEIAFLANDPDPNAAVPTGGVPYPALGVDITHFIYFKAVTDKLNAASADSFHPSLNALDALIESIIISQP